MNKTKRPGDTKKCGSGLDPRMLAADLPPGLLELAERLAPMDPVDIQEALASDDSEVVKLLEFLSDQLDGENDARIRDWEALPGED